MATRKNVSLSRRQFGTGAMLTAASAFGPALQAAPSPQSSAAVDAKYANALRKYGDRLNAQQRKQLRALIARHQAMLDRIHAVRLDNSDPPATGFRV